MSHTTTRGPDLASTKGATVAAEFEIYIDRQGSYYWRLIARDNAVVAKNGPYDTRAQAVNAAQAVKSAATSADLRAEQLSVRTAVRLGLGALEPDRGATSDR